jgi:CII-binding regulator of phage lambda lysogenization HflD
MGKGEVIMDPMLALAGIQQAISMVKKASKVASDLGSLAPMIGKMFDAKSAATKALIEAKKSKGSNMGTALQIEMALEQARAFEDELKLLFMTTGKVDVWNKIKARQDKMDIDDARELRALERAEKKAKQKEDEMNELAIIIGGSFFVLFLVFVGIYELMEFCDTTKRCGR